MTKDQVNSKAYSRVGVIGAGAWGTALAVVAAQAGRNVTLWARETEIVDSIRARGENDIFLPKVSLPKSIVATSSLAEAAAHSEALLVVVPAQHLRTTLISLSGVMARGTPLVICAKGIEQRSGKLLTEILSECAPDAQPAILSGPSFARDVARNLPTAVTIAARPEIARRLQETLSYAAFRPYASDDLTGVALGGAAKNVYAIASGIVSGLALGESAVAAIIARSFAELMRLGEALGAKRETLMGLSGLGDLVLTATSPTSRNFSFGLALGKGRTLADLSKEGHSLAEGVETAPALVLRAKSHGVELPIAETVAAILEKNVTVHDAIARLMLRPLKTE